MFKFFELPRAMEDDEAVVACIGLGAMGAPLAHCLLVWCCLSSPL
jgi:hypothetical protein